MSPFDNARDRLQKLQQRVARSVIKVSGGADRLQLRTWSN